MDNYLMNTYVDYKNVDLPVGGTTIVDLIGSGQVKSLIFVLYDGCSCLIDIDGVLTTFTNPGTAFIVCFKTDFTQLTATSSGFASILILSDTGKYATASPNSTLTGFTQGKVYLQSDFSTTESAEIVVEGNITFKRRLQITLVNPTTTVKTSAIQYGIVAEYRPEKYISTKLHS